MQDADVVIIGAGAAGLMCALAAGQRGRRVIVLEGANKIGKKILMSGGGRCNFTNVHCNAENFISENPHFCKSALSRYSQWDFVALVEQHAIAFHEKTLGQLFCDNSSKDILNMLTRECEQATVSIHTHCADSTVSKPDRFEVSSAIGEIACDSLVIASGGLSIPKMGASDFGYRIAQQFGHRILETRAGLVPFTVTGSLLSMCQRLAGVSCRVSVSAGGASFIEDLLFTHRGLSGPVILQISSYWTPGSDIAINLLPGSDASKLLLAAKHERPRSLLRVVLGDVLPKALVAELQAAWWPAEAETALAQIRHQRLQEIARMLNAWTIKPAATEGYRTAEVTLGGVDTAELSSRTLESQLCAGLYFIGEVVDVTGHLGGFNFQWAWASGQAAGQVV